MNKKSLIGVLLLLVFLFICFYYFLKPMIQPSNSSEHRCTSYSLGENQPPSLEATFFVLSLPQLQLTKEEKTSIDCFVDVQFSLANCSNFTSCLVCGKTNCSDGILYSFVKIKKELGFVEDETIKKYNIDKIYQLRPNVKFNPLTMDYEHYVNSKAATIFTERKFNEILIESNNTPITSSDQEKILLKNLIDYIPDPIYENSYNLSLYNKGMMVSAFKSLSFNNVDELKLVSEFNTTKLEYFCDLSKLEYPFNICFANYYVMVKNFCGENFRENETKLINDFLSQDYTYLPYKYCKNYFGTDYPPLPGASILS